MNKNRIAVYALLIAALPSLGRAVELELPGGAALPQVRPMTLPTTQLAPGLMNMPELTAVPGLGASPLQSLPELPKAAVININDYAARRDAQPQQTAPESGLQRVQKAMAAMPENMAQASSGDARDSGQRLEAAITGENAGRTGGANNVDLPEPASSELQQRVTAAKAVTDRVKSEIGKVIVGQHEMVESIVMAMIAGKHVLLEGVPGVAKTEASNAAAQSVDGHFQRVQGTPDLLPADIVGSEVLEKDETGKFVRQLMKGPIFTNILLVDEINRMPQKVQSALLQAMAEKKVTIGRQTFDLPHFTVLATQNPVEQIGTNPLPEAQLDRFMFKVVVEEGSLAETKAIMRLNRSQEAKPKPSKTATFDDLTEVRRAAEAISLDEGVEDYIARIARAPKLNPEIAKNLSYSVGIRASLELERAARLHAVMNGRTFVSVEDVRAVAKRVMRLRFSVSFEAQSAGVTPDSIIDKILDSEPMPGREAKAQQARLVPPVKGPGGKKIN